MANSDPNRIMEGTDDYIPTHSMIVCSPMVVKQAIEKVGLEHLPTLLAAKRADKDPVEEAILNIKVTRPDRMAKIFRVDYQAGDREETDRLVEALVASYQQFLGDTFQKNSGTVITLISKARDDLSKELKELEDQYLEFRRTNANVIVGQGQEGRSFWASRLSRWDQAANEAMVKAVQLKTQLDLGRKLAGDGAELWAIAHAITQVGGDPNSLLALVTAGSSQNGEGDFIRQLAVEQQQLVERYGPDYAKVKELKLQIDRIRDRGRNARSRLEAGELKDMLASLARSLDSVQTMREDLRTQFDQAQQKAKQVEVDLLTEENLRSKLERQRSLFSSVVDQLKQAQFVSDFTSVTSQVIEPPHTLRQPVWPRPILTLVLALVTGCMLGVGAVFFLDRLDQRVHSLAELRQAMGLSVLGEIGQVPADQLALVGPIGLISHSKPRSNWAEAFRAVRTNVDFLRRNQRLEVVMVTSPYAGDGKSTSASNLAISFAYAGRRVLLVDCDLRRPTQDKLYDLDRERGLSHLLRGPDAPGASGATHDDRQPGRHHRRTGGGQPGRAPLLAPTEGTPGRIPSVLRGDHPRCPACAGRDGPGDCRRRGRWNRRGRPCLDAETSRRGANSGAPRQPGNPRAGDDRQRNRPRGQRVWLWVWLRLWLWLRLWQLPLQWGAKGERGRSLILFPCWPRPNRNPIQTATVSPAMPEDSLT